MGAQAAQEEERKKKAEEAERAKKAQDAKDAALSAALTKNSKEELAERAQQTASIQRMEQLLDKLCFHVQSHSDTLVHMGKAMEQGRQNTAALEARLAALSDHASSRGPPSAGTPTRPPRKKGKQEDDVRVTGESISLLDDSEMTQTPAAEAAATLGTEADLEAAVRTPAEANENASSQDFS